MTNDETRMTKGGLTEGAAGQACQFPDRYSRQERLPQIGAGGQRRLLQARVVLIGCGALGSTLAQLLVRAGVGFLRVIDRDFVEANNLPRQTLYEEADVNAALPKAHAAARRLRAINSEVTIEPIAADVHAGNIVQLCDGAELLLDGTDNFQTRYLLNDLAVKTCRPWVYGACIGWEGRGLVVRPGQTPCLRCWFDEPPPAGTTPTCETVGVIGPAAVMVAGWQAGEALKLLVGVSETTSAGLMTLDLLANRFHFLQAKRRTDCPCCGQHRFDWLNSTQATDAVTLCGRDAVQVPAPGHGGQEAGTLDLATFAVGLREAAGVKIVRQNPYLLRYEVESRGRTLTLSLFGDGRAIIQGTTDFAEARNVYARYVGA